MKRSRHARQVEHLQHHFAGISIEPTRDQPISSAPVDDSHDQNDSFKSVSSQDADSFNSLKDFLRKPPNQPSDCCESPCSDTDQPLRKTTHSCAASMDQGAWARRGTYTEEGVPNANQDLQPAAAWTPGALAGTINTPYERPKQVTPTYCKPRQAASVLDTAASRSDGFTMREQLGIAPTGAQRRVSCLSALTSLSGGRRSGQP